MFIKGIGTALPLHRYSQGECWDALCGSSQFQNLSPRSRAILRKVLLGSNGIETRYLALERLEDAFEIRPDVLHARFAKHAPQLATEAARNACEQASIEPSEVDAVLISTCTGYLCPGLTSYVSEMLCLNSSVLTLDLVGQGCGAALPNLTTACSLVEAGRQNVLSICVEVCSAAFYLDDDPGVLISACLFGDGAAAAVVSSTPNASCHVRIAASQSLTAPKDRELLRFSQSGGMLRNVLSPAVPELAAGYAQQVLAISLARAGLQRGDIRGWIFHPGGRDVLAAVQTKLALTGQDVKSSASVLRCCGNLSSPSVLFVLREALNDSVPNGRWWMSSFGAGFSCHGALLEVEK